MKKLFLSIISVFVLFSFTNAQQKGANISFEKEVHDFGKIKEDDGKVEYKFMFTNTGDAPLIINNVKASCGCTSPTWTEKPIMPGQKGFVSAVYDPRNRPGNFNKSIFVETNTTKGKDILRITGEVQAREKTIEDYYPKTLGDLRLETNHFAFIKVYSNQIKKDTLKIYNSSNSEMKVTFSNLPDYLKFDVVPSVLKPGAKGYILGTYDGSKVNDWGFVSSRVNVIINGESGNNDYITISGKIEEDFSKMTDKEIANAPKIVFEDESFYFGTTKSNDKIEHDFKFTNKGKSDLVIRKIRSTCGCTTVAPAKTVIKPGESSSFKAIFDPGSRTGVQTKTVYVISNDPKNPEIRLSIKGEILNENAQNKDANKNK
ncbi:MAG TPA: DUF1573 domain-containing protein [Bacteroidales bacterium]|jgi:hypothetical protein|nr:DUF1573 domain-containing protein [Bacteroidales bacterium]